MIGGGLEGQGYEAAVYALLQGGAMQAITSIFPELL